MSRKFVFARLAVMASLALPGITFAEDRLSVAIEQSLDDAKAGRPYVTVTVTNVSDAPAWFNRVHSPFDLVEGHAAGNWFRFEGGRGAGPVFIGRQQLIRAFYPEDYERLDPGASRSTSLDLSPDYRFPNDGTYLVSTGVVSFDHVPTDEGDISGRQWLKTDLMELHVSTAYVGSFTPLADSVIPCTGEQEKGTGQAYVKALNMTSTRERLNKLSYYYDPVDPDQPDKPPRKHMRRDAKYVYWLGEWDDDAPQPPDDGHEDTDNAKVDATVHATLLRLRSDLKIVCDLCPKSHPETRGWADGEGIVHLCPANFRDPVIGGISSQTATLIHEASHIVDGYGPSTVDLPGVYSRETAHALPRPEAVRSAANYEYFIANTPLGLGAENADIE
ncbi:hypothetical protein L2Y96_19915 [Luteibacter aegosomaticola]|uniref:hypothetical protein n=1 Tax=Luteibacter aegosomaticola TaxID=2911538 RepID=UPI001FFA4E26|nr:hypothetical protein [Luteibacter aegosomaticola]UPG89630.1 hypothetical protein L2Y96_19915 [Luteibacter aegosomaticola]